MGRVSRMLVDLLDISIDLSVCVLEDYISLGFNLLVGVADIDMAISLIVKIVGSIDNYSIIVMVDCHRGSVVV